MKLRKLAISLALVGMLAQTATAAPQASPDPLESRLTEVSAFFSATPPKNENSFTARFLKSVPIAQLAALSKDMYEKYGPISATKLLKQASPEQGTFLLTFKRGYEAKFELVLEAEAPHRIAGMWVGEPTPVAGDLQTLVAEFKKLPGNVSFSACRLDDKGVHPVAELNPEAPLALGSGFKLFVLGALIEEVAAGKRHWTDVLSLKSEWKSLPSGILQDWPAGSSLTLQSLASLMISGSDNTATDHLLMALGRERVERMQSPMGVSHPNLNQPFLTTREMFLLKGRNKEKAIPAYLAQKTAGRRLYLRNVVVRQSLREADPAQERPVAIDTIEWFASSRDMVQAMDWLRRHTSSETTLPARKILAINPGISFDSTDWSYIGYKGGSEPGVLSMTFLLQSHQGAWYAMSACWSDTQADVDQNRMIALLNKAGNLLAKTKI